MDVSSSPTLESASPSGLAVLLRVAVVLILAGIVLAGVVFVQLRAMPCYLSTWQHWGKRRARKARHGDGGPEVHMTDLAARMHRQGNQDTSAAQTTGMDEAMGDDRLALLGWLADDGDLDDGRGIL
jgi:hypothetical protein